MSPKSTEEGPGDFKRLADAVRAARRRKGWSQLDLAMAARISKTSIENVEGQLALTRLPNTIGKVEAALGWEPGLARRIAYEGAPISFEQSDAAAPGGHVVGVKGHSERRYGVGPTVADEHELTARQIVRMIPAALEGVESLGAVEVLRQVALVTQMLDREAGDERVTMSAEDPHRGRLVEQIKSRSRPGGGVELTLSIHEPHAVLAASPLTGDPLIVVNPTLEELPEFFRSNPEIRRDYDNAVAKRPLDIVQAIDPTATEVKASRNGQPARPGFPDEYELAAREVSPEQLAQRDAEDRRGDDGA